MKTAVSIPDAVFRSAERLAKRLGVSRSALYARAVEKFVKERSKENRSARIEQALMDLDSDVDPALAKLSARALKHELRDDKW